MHIESGQSKAVTKDFSQESLVPYELIIQSSTVVEYLGYHLSIENVIDVPPTEVTFEEAGKITGNISK